MPYIPHKAVVTVKAEIMEVLPTGHVTGVPKNTIKKIVVIDGTSLEDCEQKVLALFNKVKNGSNPKRRTK